MRINKKIAGIMAMLAILGTSAASADLSVLEDPKDLNSVEIVLDNSTVAVETTDTSNATEDNSGFFDYVASFLVQPAEASGNEMSTMVGNTASGSIKAAGEIMATPFGSIVYFILGITLLTVVIGVIFWISHKG